MHHQLIGHVVGQPMAARLRFQEQGKSRIAANIDPLNGIHLYGDI
jgi:hypothetical protein